MAMILDASIGRYLNMLEQLIEEKVVMILGVKDDLKRLQEKMEMIKDVLSDAERRRIQDAATNRWLSRVKDVLYDADNIIDLCRIKGLQLLQEGGQPQSPTSSLVRCGFPLFSCFNSVTNIPFHHEISTEIQKLNKRLEEISTDRIMFTLQHVSSNMLATQVNLRQTSPLSNSVLAGTETAQAADRLVESLVKAEGEGLLVFAIIGLGGIGKTTLAQRIYSHKKVQSNFQKRLWVCVSQNFSEIELLKQMIRSAGGDHGHAQTSSNLSSARPFPVTDSFLY